MPDTTKESLEWAQQAYDKLKNKKVEIPSFDLSGIEGKIDALTTKINKYEERIKKLEKDSHPRADWICMDCGCKAKKVTKPTRRK